MENNFNVSTTEKHQFPCKECGAFLVFAPGTSSLKCQYCGTLNEIETSDEEIEEIDYERFISNMSTTAEKIQVATVKCTSCGAESTLKPNVTSDNCPFCGTALVVSTGSLHTGIKPKSLLPFMIEQKQGFGLFKDWINSLWFAPNDLKNFANSPDRLSGMYIPYWTYDANTYTNYTGERGEYYYETESYRDSDGKMQTREVQKTRWYYASGSVNNDFDDVLVIASNSLPRDYTQELEPWDVHALVPFNEKYLSGFRAESYQVDVKEGFTMAKVRMDETIDTTIRSDIGGDTQRIHTKNTIYNDITFKHILLPIWISAYKYSGKVYRFMINGRTGEVQGERPWSWIKITLAVLFAVAIIGVVLYFNKGKKRRSDIEKPKTEYYAFHASKKNSVACKNNISFVRSTI